MSSTQVVTTKKTVGTTTLSATGGSVVGGAIAAIVLYFFPDAAQVALLAPLTIVVSAVCALVGGYLAPSKAETLAPYLDQASEDIAQRVADKAPTAKVPSVQEVAETAAAKLGFAVQGASISPDSTDTAQNSVLEPTPATVEPDLQKTRESGTDLADVYPDLDAMAKIRAV